MTDYAEDQSGELETLRCIYTEKELTEVSDSPHSFQIEITSSEEEEDCEVVSVVVQFMYPPTYPDVPPEMEVTSQTGLSSDHVQGIESLLQEQAVENLGMVMVFTLVSAVQDRLGEVVESVRAEREREKERREEEIKRKEEAKFHGTPVTMETFLEWKRRFEEELRGGTGSKETSQQPPRLTGRQMFERDASLALSDARFLTEASLLTESEQRETVEVDESLFQDLEDLELEDT